MEAATGGGAATAAQPFVARPMVAAAKALGLLCLASLWVASAAMGAATVKLAASGCDDGCLAYHALVAVSIRAFVFGALLALVAPLLFLRAVWLDAAFREEIIRHWDWEASSSRGSVGSMMRQTHVGMFLASLAFALLSAIGSLLLMVLSPTKGSQTESICAMLLVVGIVGSMAIFCFFILPLMAWNLWRMKLGGVAVARSNI